MHRALELLTSLRARRWIAAAALAAVAVALLLRPEYSMPPGPYRLLDPAAYDRIARELLDSGRYAEQLPHAPLYRAWRPPGYPVFLALCYSLGNPEPDVVIAAQRVLLALLAAICGAGYWIAARSGLGAVVVTGLVGSIPGLRFRAELPFSETLFTFLLYGGLASIALGAERRSRRWLGAGGILLGVATLTRAPLLHAIALG
ncbi:MAG: hypothetical protein JRI23_24980, partial [Deltaproteobacteria bacterium]|nr:hypothetical protein [Deltaproteobacteria bacterium]MBW2535271.1 hypothetical protein [Deltaproteobacteria bacterium]